MSAYDVSTEGAVRFEFMMDAIARGDKAAAAAWLVSIPAADLDAIDARFARYGIDSKALLAGKDS
jgi:hypothetical protein